MEVSGEQLQRIIEDAERRGYARGRRDAAGDVAAGALLLTRSASALDLLGRLAAGRPT